LTAAALSTSRASAARRAARVSTATRGWWRLLHDAGIVAFGTTPDHPARWHADGSRRANGSHSLSALKRRRSCCSYQKYQSGACQRDVVAASAFKLRFHADHKRSPMPIVNSEIYCLFVRPEGCQPCQSCQPGSGQGSSRDNRTTGEAMIARSEMRRVVRPCCR
jgi:hypothetical protein